MIARIPLPNFAAESTDKKSHIEAMQRYQAEYCLNTVAPQKHNIFQMDRCSLQPENERHSHWSIAWSDLMMTMFILFLSLFVYQAAHKDFLVSNEREIIAGKTEKTIEVAKNPTSSFPFMVIKPAAPLMTAGTIKKVETVALQDIDVDSTFSPVEVEKTLAELANQILPVATTIPEVSAPPEKNEALHPNESAHQFFQPPPLAMHQQAETSVNSLFDQSQITLDTFNLNEFASIDLVPDKAVRITLTGDLLFETGEATLSTEAIYSLEKIADILYQTQHQIHVEGHTDNVPVHSGKYANNRELSLARANAVAVFLIEDMGLEPRQFVVSGYSSYRPVAPNTTAENRASNRRVEIVITQTPYHTNDAPLASTFYHIEEL